MPASTSSTRCSYGDVRMTEYTLPPGLSTATEPLHRPQRVLVALEQHELLGAAAAICRLSSDPMVPPAPVHEEPLPSTRCLTVARSRPDRHPTEQIPRRQVPEVVEPRPPSRMSRRCGITLMGSLCDSSSFTTPRNVSEEARAIATTPRSICLADDPRQSVRVPSTGSRECAAHLGRIVIHEPTGDSRALRRPGSPGRCSPGGARAEIKTLFVRAFPLYSDQAPADPRRRMRNTTSTRSIKNTERGRRAAQETADQQAEEDAARGHAGTIARRSRSPTLRPDRVVEVERDE